MSAFIFLLLSTFWDKHETYFVEIPFLFPVPLTDYVIFEIQFNLYEWKWFIGDTWS